MTDTFENLAALHAECFPKKPWSADDFRDLKRSGNEIIFSDNGFLVWRVAADEAEIISICVRPESRNQGIASSMIAIMESEFKKFGNVNKIFLEVEVNNEAAIELYSAAGFEKISTRPSYYDGIDAIIMQKNI
jgi:ribosomal-protein-alanine N-acetyltransferase